LRWLIDNPGPSYLRLGKAGEPRFHDDIPEVAPGCWLQVRAGDDADIALSTGGALGAAIQRADGRAVYSLPLWGMAAKPAQREQIAARAKITTFEDHLADAGFGSWLAESVVGTADAAKITPIALSAKVCDMVASQAALNRLGGLAA
jgi:transketolase